MPTDLQQAIHLLAANIHDRRTDAALIAAFLLDLDQDAFTELVRRHGSMVLGVCRRFLGQTSDAEDAFQATFLVLIRRARQTAWRHSLGPWLYGVASRVARKARARRFLSPKQASEMAIEPTIIAPTPDDFAAVLDEELAALPEIYRLPLLLCELQGLSRKDAARELGLPEGTLSSRLGRGRRLLRERLIRKGVSPAIAGVAAIVPAELVSATVQNAVAILTRSVGTVPAGVVFLMEGVVKTMIVKWKSAAVMIAACFGLVGYGAWQGAMVPAKVAAADPPRILTTPPLDDQPGKALDQSGKPVPYPPAPSGVSQPKPSDPVATIFGDVTITREEFGNHLIQRYGKKELELFVNKQILIHAFGNKGRAISAKDLFATLDADCKALGMTQEEFAKNVLPRYGKTMTEWLQDVIEPRIMLAELSKNRIAIPTQEELRLAFDAKYGEMRSGRVIVWPGTQKEAEAAYSKATASEEAFDCAARTQSNHNLATTRGMIAPVARVPLFDVPNNPEVNKAVAQLKPGEITPLLKTDKGFMTFKCDTIIPPDSTKSFDAEKPMLLAELVQEKIRKETVVLFNELKKEANPKYHLTFPDTVVHPNPVPVFPMK